MSERRPIGRMAGNQAGERAKDFGATMRRILSRLSQRRWTVAVILLFTAISVSLSVAGPKLLGNATNIIFDGVVGKMIPAGTSIDQAVAGLRAQGQNRFADLLAGMPNVVPGEGINFAALRWALIIVVGIYLGSFLLQWIQGILTVHVVQGSMHELRTEVERKLHSLPLSHFDKAPRGEILSRVTNDIDNLGQTLQQTLSQIVQSVLTVIGVLAMMVWISWQLALIAVVMIPVSAVAIGMVTKHSGPQFAAQWKATGDLNAHVEEMYTGHGLVKAFGQQETAKKEFAVRNEAIYQASFKAQFISGIIPGIMGFLGNLTYVAVAVFGGLRVASGTMSLGDVQAFIQYSRQFTMPIGQLAAMMNLLQSGAASAERVFDLLDSADQLPDKSAHLVATTGNIDFDHVQFSYAPDKPLITDLSLRVCAGQTVAIVGHTGAGKTTLVNLLERFYDIDGGMIRLDGIDISTVPRALLRDRLGMVLQDTWLFGGTIAQNIAYGKLEATQDEIEQAARDAYVDRFVHSLPAGYETVIAEESSNLSAGEKQLITIARAFLADPEVLILDEATSSVDTRTEVLVQEAMARLRVGRTAFVIAHRLSTIRDADVIVVMAQGDIVEQGNHQDLLASGGVYAQLYQSQFSSAISS